MSGAGRRRLVWIGVPLVVLAVTAATAFAVLELEILRSTSTERGELLTTNEAAEPTPTATPRTSKRRGAPPAAWTIFRYDERRTGFNPSATARPPFTVLWSKRAPPGQSLEAPPVVDDGVLVYGSYGFERGSDLVGIDARTGRRLWRRHYRHPTNFAGSPAIAGGRVYVTAHDGHLRVHNLRTGALKWQMRTAAAESPPIVDGDYVYFGDGPPGGNGRFRAVHIRTHRVRWSFEAAGTISSGAALTRNTLYFASYGGSVYALNRATGRLRWRTSVRGARNNAVPFYSTPALSEGLLVVGGIDGSVYALDARTGEQRWRYDGGGYVYASPAIWRGRVYIGDFGGDFVALGLKTGRRLWRARVGPIIGSATVMAGAVYVSSHRPTRAYAFDARSGRRIWSFRDGRYSPIVADGKSVWLSGKRSVYRLAERDSTEAAAARRARARQAGRAGRADRAKARKARQADRAKARKARQADRAKARKARRADRAKARKARQAARAKARKAARKARARRKARRSTSER